MLPCMRTEFFVAALLLAQRSISACNIHVADFRGFGRQGCYDENLGIWTIIDTDFEANECKSLIEENVHSLTLVDIRRECQRTYATRLGMDGAAESVPVHVFSDRSCTQGWRIVQPKHCVNSPEGLRSWSMECIWS